MLTASLIPKIRRLNLKSSNNFKNGQKNYNELTLAFEHVKWLIQVEPHSKDLSKLSELCLEAIQNPVSIKN